MSIVLPSTLNYAQQLPALPECQSFTQTIAPVNGASFGPNDVIIFDLGSRGFIDPKSIYLRYKMTLTNTSAAAIVATMIACPFYTPFVRLETIIGSTIVESINQYNQVAGHLLMNTTFSTAEKYGLQSALGYTGTEANPAMSKMDGKTFPSMVATTGKDESYYSGALIGSILTNCEKLLPVFTMPSIRIQLTLDSLANMFNVAPSTIALTNVELCYSFIDFGADVERMVLQMGPKLYIKSNSFSNTSTRLASATSGSTTLIYNQRFASIKSAYILFSGTTTNSKNKWADSYDPTSANGDIQLFIGGVAYPQRPLSYLNNKTGILSELRRAIGSIYDRTNAMSINTIEFDRDGDEETYIDEPAKCIVGIELEKLNTNGALLTGISSQNSPISVQLNNNRSGGTAANYNVNLILNYDALLEIDLENRQVSVKQ